MRQELLQAKSLVVMVLVVVEQGTRGAETMDGFVEWSLWAEGLQ